MDVQSFDSFEEMQQAIQAGLDYGARSIHPNQLNVTYGSHWVQFARDYGIVICGQVATLEEIRASVLDSDPTAVGEADAEVRMTEDSMANHMLYGQAYSVIEPDGEWGSTHRMNTWPIRPELFEAFRAAGWDHRRLEPEFVLEAAVLDTIDQLWRKFLAQRDRAQGS